ncbi:nuclear transport factor 2 family protein [Maritalea sp.]|uniref:nuclear transport factor 2 family protein n=1 Tax=Maritalea sp. TaxID=2003361 RepID=UPI003EF49808
MAQFANNTAENSALMDVIACETDMFLRQDFDGWAACWVQDDRVREVCISSSFGATVLEGWDKLSDYMRNVMESGAVCNISQTERFNINITISGDIAHVVFDENSKNSCGQTERTFETRVLERSDGKWRILYASFVLRGHQQIDSSRLAVNANGEVLCAPDEALAQLKSHPGLQISNNKLRATKPAWDKILQAGLKCAAEQHGYFQHYRYMAENGRNFRLPLVLGETDEGSVSVCILFVRDGLTFVETQNDGDIDARLSVAKFVFGLSEGQMLLAQRIVLGDNLTTASEILGISVNTARTHLSRVYIKTGVNSQTALVRTLLSVG